MAEWYSKFPDEPGWYWCYQALPKGNGESISPIWVDTMMRLPPNIEGYYGPVEAPEVPLEIRPAEYRKFHMQPKEEGDGDKPDA